MKWKSKYKMQSLMESKYKETKKKLTYGSLPAVTSILTAKTLVYIIGGGTSGSPLLYYHKKGWNGAWECKGCDWPLSKCRAGGKGWAWISGMLPDTG